MERIILEEDLVQAVQIVLDGLNGIDKLYDLQQQVMRILVSDNCSLFLTAPTSSGKTLPPVILPSVLKALHYIGYSDLPVNGRVLFITAMNSIQLSLYTSMIKLGINCVVIKKDNVDDILNVQIPVLFISPETLKHRDVTKYLLQVRQNFVLAVIDEAHLGK